MNGLISQLIAIAKDTEIIGNEVYAGFKGDMSSDLQHMCMLFSKRQLNQLHSLILLKNSDDLILIARSMFEGILYLSASVKNNKMCRK